jgi:hypothetical protein
MDLTLRKGYWIKFYMKLIAVISHDNYGSQFCRPSCKLVHYQAPSTGQAILPNAKYS